MCPNLPALLGKFGWQYPQTSASPSTALIPRKPWIGMPFSEPPQTQTIAESYRVLTLRPRQSLPTAQKHPFETAKKTKTSLSKNDHGREKKKPACQKSLEPRQNLKFKFTHYPACCSRMGEFTKAWQRGFVTSPPNEPRRSGRSSCIPFSLNGNQVPSTCTLLLNSSHKRKLPLLRQSVHLLTPEWRLPKSIVNSCDINGLRRKDRSRRGIRSPRSKQLISLSAEAEKYVLSVWVSSIICGVNFNYSLLVKSLSRLS